MQYLYRAYGSDDKLLYVGISGRWSERLHEHERLSDWMQETEFVTIEKFETRDQVVEAEKLAIKAERPQYNKAHNEAYEDVHRHFQQIKRWIQTDKTDLQHWYLITTMASEFKNSPDFLKPKRAHHIAWAFRDSYHWLDYARLIQCRNCDAISRHGTYNSWADSCEEKLEEAGYYDQ